MCGCGDWKGNRGVALSSLVTQSYGDVSKTQVEMLSSPAPSLRLSFGHKLQVLLLFLESNCGTKKKCKWPLNTWEHGPPHY